MNNLFIDEIDFLWDSFRNGDDKSFSIIYQCHINKLLSYGLKISSDREIVYDCIQDVFVDLFLKRHKFNVDIKDLKAYLFSALRNSILKRLSKNRRLELFESKEKQEELVFNVEYSFQEHIINQEISTEINEKLKRAITSLPSRQKEIIYLKFEEGMSYEEIASILKITIESARKLIYRALISLREKIDNKLFQVLFFICFQEKLHSYSVSECLH